MRAGRPRSQDAHIPTGRASDEAYVAKTPPRACLVEEAKGANRLRVPHAARLREQLVRLVDDPKARG